jgi:hypothetical protein
MPDGYGVDLKDYDYLDGVFVTKKSKMPEVIDKIEKIKQIDVLLKEVAADIPNLKNGVKVEHVLSNIYAILRVMNDR